MRTAAVEVPADEQFLRPHQVRCAGKKYERLTADALAALRKRQQGPRFLQLVPRGHVYYTLADIDAWLERMTVDPASLGRHHAS